MNVLNTHAYFFRDMEIVRLSHLLEKKSGGWVSMGGSDDFAIAAKNV